MRTSGACIAALLLLAIGISAARQLQQGNAIHVIDPWAPGIKCAFLCLRGLASTSRVRKEARRGLVQLLYQLSPYSYSATGA